jgi:hypothetical protein
MSYVSEEIERYVRLSEQVPGWTRVKKRESLRGGASCCPLERRSLRSVHFSAPERSCLPGRGGCGAPVSFIALIPSTAPGDAFSVPHHERILAEFGGSPLRDQFEWNILAAGLEQCVRIHQGRAEEVAGDWTIPIDLLFLDGDQSRSGVRNAYDS